MNEKGHNVPLDSEEIDLVYDALRYARDAFTDETGSVGAARSTSVCRA